ncbi:Transcriptional regulator, AraC family [Arcticibacter svalbardensis MN12-7]|uniref:Transcriptional regulator, AraC family n=1 Tax=Arcticibacter svalbardensis MN12-7 TaxID=1150600 RepID=R9GPD3_9SPHI|nr:AraC family transcriptional regulator [Arcticibacter svalbardensis]EOR93578.1 Transcriptional regulator, AraC family [Arcticibacter svalbardensis MN12-7]
MFKVEIKDSKEKILPFGFQQPDYPLVNLYFTSESIKITDFLWTEIPAKNDNLITNTCLMEITLSKEEFLKITDHQLTGTKKTSLPILNIITDILHCSCHPKFKKVYLQTKVCELVIQVLSTASIATSEFQWTEKEKMLFHQLKELIEKNLSKNYSIGDLAMVAGMNRTKMQTGFKDLFGKTIYTYTIDLKMMEAKALLSKEHAVSLKEIASKLGYKHTNHFSAAFKKKFTFSPSSFKKGINLLGALFAALISSY